MKISAQLRVAFLVVSGAMLCGCADDEDVVAMQQAEVLTPNVTIKAADGSFNLTSGQAIKTPFVSGSLNNCGFEGKYVTHVHDALTQCGAENVLVYVPGRDAPLYGALMLENVVPEDVSVEGMYRIEVPQNYIDQASQGQISLVYEITPSNHYSWFLWLSDHPLQ